MAYTEVKRTNIFQRFLNSIGGIVVGILLFFASFGVLFWNEGRVNIANVAEESVAISAESLSDENEGDFVSVTSEIVATEVVGDGLFLNPDNYLAIQRKVEMFAWVEETKTTTRTEVGGTEVEETEYTYTKKWVESPADTSNFKQPEDKFNPDLPFRSETYYNPSVKLGAYAINIKDAGVGEYSNLELTSSIISDTSVYVNSSEYLFQGNGSLSSPQVGDVRISYDVSKPGQLATIFGKKEGDRISSYYDEKSDTTVYELRNGNRDKALDILNSEHRIMTWVLRGVGFLMMWIGLNSLFGPIVVLLSVLPFLGSIGRGLFAFITFLVALVLSTITIIVSIILNNIWALLAVVTLTIAVAGYLFYKKREKDAEVVT